MKKESKKNINRKRKFFPKWVNFKNVLLICIFLGLICIIIYSESISFYLGINQLAGVEPLLSTTLPVDPPTPLPEELIRSVDQTNGVISGAIIIILTIIIGTIAIFFRDRE